MILTRIIFLITGFLIIGLSTKNWWLVLGVFILLSGTYIEPE